MAIQASHVLRQKKEIFAPSIIFWKGVSEAMTK
jgi:hypothetical protein